MELNLSKEQCELINRAIKRSIDNDGVAEISLPYMAKGDWHKAFTVYDGEFGGLLCFWWDGADGSTRMETMVLNGR